MNASRMTLDQIRHAGVQALSRELGAVGMVRFLQQFETGFGNYSVERHAWIEKSDVRALAEEIRRRRKNPAAEVASGSSLTSREREILHLLAEGDTNRQIADKLSLSSEAVHSHARKLFRKIGVGDRGQAALYAKQHDASTAQRKPIKYSETIPVARRGHS